MGLLDKLKDLFMDEVIDDEEYELEEENKKLYEEPKDILPKVMRDTIKKEESGINFDDLKPLKEESTIKEEVTSASEKKFSFPIDFEEVVSPSRVASRSANIEQEMNREVSKEIDREKVMDVPKRDVRKVETTKKETVRREEVKKVELYPKKEVVVEKPKFKPTPVISPVYGVLDKNYRKEEVREKSEENFEMKRPSKSVDFETVRKKAFGNLVDEIKENLMCENCELYKEVKRISSVSSDDLLYDMMVDDKVDEPVTIEKAYDNYEGYGVAYEPKKEITKIENNTTIINNNTDLVIAEKIEIEEKNIEEIKDVKESREVINEEVTKIPSRQETKKECRESKVDEDFFELIDSMYKERIDG